MSTATLKARARAILDRIVEPRYVPKAAEPAPANLSPSDSTSGWDGEAWLRARSAELLSDLDAWKRERGIGVDR
jgi:hypothetical protein